MKKLLFVGIGIALSLSCFAEDRLPGPGMESLDIGSTEVIVPKDRRAYKEGSLIKLEDLDVYVARKLEEVQQSIEELKRELAAVVARQQELEAKLESMESSRSSTPRE